MKKLIMAGLLLLVAMLAGCGDEPSTKPVCFDEVEAARTKEGVFFFSLKNFSATINPNRYASIYYPDGTAKNFDNVSGACRVVMFNYSVARKK